MSLLDPVVPATRMPVRDFLSRWGLLLLGITGLLGLVAWESFVYGRLPYFYFAPQYFITYEFGFVKRGLMGAVLHLLLGDALYQYRTVVAVSAVIFAGLLAMLVWLCCKLGRARLPWLLPFIAGPGFYYLLGSWGSFDIVVYLLALLYLLASTALRSVRAHTSLLLGLGVLGLLIHEASLLTSIPVMCFVYYLSLLRLSADEQKTGWQIEKQVLAVFLVLGLVSVLVSQLSMDLTLTKDLLYRAAAMRADFSPARFPFEILHYTVGDNLFAVNLHNRSGNNLFYILYCALVAGLASLPYWMLARQQTGLPHRGRILLALLCCSLLPMALHLIGTDYMRWSASMARNAFLCWAVLCLYFSPQGLKLSWRAWLVSAAVALTMLWTPYPVRGGDNRTLSDWPKFAAIWHAYWQDGLEGLPKPINPARQCQVRQADGTWCNFQKEPQAKR